MIEVKGLYKDFGALHVLRDVSLNVEQGDIISIIGPSGSGKSTLLRSINLLEKPTYGEIWVEGKLITPPDPYLHGPQRQRPAFHGPKERAVHL